MNFRISTDWSLISRDPNADDGQEPRQTLCVAPKIVTIRLEFSVRAAASFASRLAAVLGTQHTTAWPNPALVISTLPWIMPLTRIGINLEPRIRRRHFPFFTILVKSGN